MATFKGTDGVLHEVVSEGDIVRGTTTHRTFVGSKDYCDAIAAQANLDGLAFHQGRIGGPVYFCTVVYPYEFGAIPEPQTVWEFDNQFNTSNIFTLLGAQEESVAWGAANPVQGKAGYKQGIEEAVSEPKDLPQDIFPIDTYPVANDIYALLSAGTDGYEREFVVLHRFQTAPNEYAPDVDLNLGKTIYATDDLIKVFSVPDYVSRCFKNLPASTEDTTNKLVYGWRFKPGRRRFVGIRVEVADEWVFTQWTTRIYSLYTETT